MSDAPAAARVTAGASTAQDEAEGILHMALSVGDQWCVFRLPGEELRGYIRASAEDKNLFLERYIKPCLYNLACAIFPDEFEKIITEGRAALGLPPRTK